MACGVYDRDISGRAFWMSQLGGSPTPEVLLAMHPLRSKEWALPRRDSEPKQMTAAEQALFDELTGG